MKLKKLSYILLFIVGIAGIIDTLAVLAIVPGINLGVILPSIIGIVLCLYSFIKLKYQYKFIRGKFTRILSLLILLSIVLFIIIEGMIIFSGYSEVDKDIDIDYVMVLGAGIDSAGNPTPLLKNRLNRCIEYINSNSKSKIIVSGGKGYGEPITEAESMRDYLVNNNIREDRIILEDKSTSTYENFIYTKDMLVKEGRFNSNILVITNDFHMMRSKSIARKLGLNVCGLSSKTPSSTIINSYLREFFAVIKTWLVDF